MEAVKEEEGFAERMRAPRLEDAGLEDCALSPNSIREAFFKAAANSSIRSLVAEDDRPGGGGNGRGLGELQGDDDEAKTGGGESVIESRGASKGEGKSCVEGLRGLHIEEDEEKKGNPQESERDEDDKEEPILAQAE